MLFVLGLHFEDTKHFSVSAPLSSARTYVGEVTKSVSVTSLVHFKPRAQFQQVNTQFVHTRVKRSKIFHYFFFLRRICEHGTLGNVIKG